jgi:putative SOS response-associated peptidase YedK
MRKQPMFIGARDGEPIAFAGLWEIWRASPADDWVRTCTIITTRANKLLAPIHDRMPVMLPEDTWASWLDPANDDPKALRAMLARRRTTYSKPGR